MSGLVAHKLSGLNLQKTGGDMSLARLLQEIKKMRFEETYNGWTSKRLSQEEAARLLGISERSFRRYVTPEIYIKQYTF